MNGCTNGCMHGFMDRCINGYIDGCMNGCVNGYMDGDTERCIMFSPSKVRMLPTDIGTFHSTLGKVEVGHLFVSTPGGEGLLISPGTNQSL